MLLSFKTLLWQLTTSTNMDSIKAFFQTVFTSLVVPSSVPSIQLITLID
jgi:hypothetical protein